MKVLFQICCFLALSGPQVVSAKSAQELLSGCRSIANAGVVGKNIQLPKTFQAGVCWGTFGVIQEIIVHIDETRQPIYGVCAPPNSRLSQLITIFVSYAEKNPQRLHEEGFEIALDSLQLAFPCKS